MSNISIAQTRAEYIAELNKLPSKTRRFPWKLWPGESAKAYDAFRIYLELGPTRTVGKVGKAKNYTSKWAYNWAAKHFWRHRAQAFDEYEIEDKLNTRVVARETARQVAIEKAVDLVNKLIGIAMGDECPSNPVLAGVQLGAIKEALSLAGVAASKKNAIDVNVNHNQTVVNRRRVIQELTSKPNVRDAMRLIDAELLPEGD